MGIKRPTRDEIFLKSRLVVLPFFQPIVRMRLNRLDPSISTLETGLLRIFREFVNGHDKHTPTVEAFISATSEIFSDQYKSFFIENAARFDKVSGFEESVTEAFLQAEPLSLLLERVAVGISARAERAAIFEADKGETGSGSATANSPSNASTSPTRLPFTPSEDEMSHSGDNGQTEDAMGPENDPSAEPEPPCPIIDIELSGPTIREAWRSHALMRSMEAQATRPIRQDPTWCPDSSTQMVVYHGTPAPLEGDIRFADRLAHHESYNTILRGSVAANNVAPTIDDLPLVWTAFSPLRSFLWACFLSDVMGAIPPTSIHQSYNCTRLPLHTHSGVRLLEFIPRLYQSEDRRVFTMPHGVEDAWAELVKRSELRSVEAMRGSTDTALVWRIFSRLHEEPSGMTWPEIMHCHEVTSQTRMLSNFTKQLWRTVWSGTGITELNRSYQRVFSITMNIEPPAASTTAPIAEAPVKVPT